jgi:adenylate kinase family enzyme
VSETGIAGIGRRVLVIGPSCSGKSTLGEQLAAMLAVPFVELDALHWKPDWVGSGDEEFAEKLAAATAGDAWVVAGSYWRVSSKVTWPRAETVVWLDFSKRTTMPRILRRSWRRWRADELLWGTNREKFWEHFKVWSDESLIGFTLRHHDEARRRNLGLMFDPQWAHLRWVHLRSPRDLAAWMGAMSNEQ